MIGPFKWLKRPGRLGLVQMSFLGLLRFPWGSCLLDTLQWNAFSCVALQGLTLSTEG